MMKPSDYCVFCEIINGNETNNRILFENDKLIIIEDIVPASDHHYLAIPKQHIIDATRLQPADIGLVQEMETKLKDVLVKNDLNPASPDVSIGFHWPPFISVAHLHMHAIAPVSRMNKRARWKFKQNNVRYCTVQFVCDQIENTCGSNR